MMITVITPAYNPGKLILETMESLNKQTFKKFEWIIIDDNSNQENKVIIESIRARALFPVHIIRNSTNLRQTKSKNIGLEKAQGRYIKFLDADDLLDAEHLENQFNLLESKENNNIAIFSPTINFDCNIKNSRVNNSYKSVVQENTKQLERFLVYPFFHHCSCLFHKKCIVDIDGFDAELITDEDGDLILRLMLEGILFIPEEKSAYYYRKHDINIRVSANDSDEKWLARLDVCIKVERKLSGKYTLLKEPLAQRLDLIGLSCTAYSEELAKVFFNNAKRIYPNYSKPGSMLVRSIRTLFGNNGYWRVKKMLRKS